jgi:hypothetical protein
MTIGLWACISLKIWNVRVGDKKASPYTIKQEDDMAKSGKKMKFMKNLDSEIENLQDIANRAEVELHKEKEWIERYKKYACEILDIQNIVKETRELFRINKPLFVYSSIRANTTSKNHIKFDLRYRGQSVAEIDYEKKKEILRLKSKQTEKYYRIKDIKGVAWKDAESFRGQFSKYPERESVGGKKNIEHRYESALLTALTRDKEAIRDIWPVFLHDKEIRFQMATPFSASTKNPKYGNCKGGGIDLLCRVGKGKDSKLSIFELKDVYEDPMIVLRQTVIYAVFIHRLLKTPDEGNENWWKIFGYEKVPPMTKPLVFNVVAALPQNKNGENDKRFGGKEIKIGSDTFRLHYFYFNVDGKYDQVKNIETSLFSKKKEKLS